MLGEDLLKPPVTAGRIDRAVAPSFRRIDGDAFELSTDAADSSAALDELRRLDPSFDWSGYTAELVEAKADPAAWHRDEAFGADGRKMPATTRPVVRKRYLIRRAQPSAGHADLIRFVLTRKPKRSVNVTGGAYVVCLADMQIGKVDRSGGTEGTLGRALDKVGAAVRAARKIRPSRIVLADVGDGLENFDNHPGQAYTNDLSLPQQIDLFQAVTLRAVTDLAAVAPVTFVSVPSNHCQWRRGGRQSAGTPGDDWGINNARSLTRIFATAGRSDVDVVIPETYAESLTLDVDGLPVAFAHGHQVSSPDRLADWWRGQTFGDGPAAGARLAVFGHWHSLRVQSVGNGKTIMVCPTLDPGSSWFTNQTGEESAPGLLTFRVADGVWRDLQVL